LNEYIENIERKTSERKEYQRKVANAFGFWKAEGLLIKPVDKDRIEYIYSTTKEEDNCKSL
jgi:uncharacterized protein (UPF0335 family)